MIKTAVLFVALLLLPLLTGALKVYYEGEFSGTGREPPPPPPSSQKRSLVLAAAESRQWNVLVRCSLALPDLVRVYNALVDMNSGQFACKIPMVVQATRQSLFVVTCDTSAAANGDQIRALFASPTTGVASASCDPATKLDVRLDAPVGLHAPAPKPPPPVRAATTTQPAGAIWNLDRLNQRGLPLDGSYVYARQGSGVTIYVIDTGVLTTHSDFGGRVVEFTNYAGDGVDSDCNGHGTHVAGTAAGATYGVAKNATIVALKVLDCSGSGSFSSVITALLDIADRQDQQRHPAVATMSLAGGAYSLVDQVVGNLSTSSRVAITVAAGNAGADACSYSPARAPAALTVAATDSPGVSGTTDALASYSNRGSCVDLAAPGSSIRSTWNTGNYATNVLSGTSMATPLVAGMCALMLEDQMLANATSFDGPTAQAAVLAMATPNRTASTPRYALLFSSVGMPPVPPPPPPPPPPSTTTSGGGAPQPNTARPTTPLGRFASDGARDVLVSVIALVAPLALAFVA